MIAMSTSSAPQGFKEQLRAALEATSPLKVSLDDARDAAVLIPIVARPEPSLIFTVRTESLSHHKGQIAFPGGSIDPGDESPIAAALRESQEEIGLDQGAIEVLGELDAFPTYVSGFVVTPVIGWIEQRPELRPNPAEVAAVLEVPISHLNEEIRAEAGFAHRDRTYPTEAWVWNDNVIWGVTARIVRSFLSLLAEAGLADAPGETTSWTGWPSDAGRAS
jgi:8-oxo-dGTP pyrophosphatase MutT (NUDIX family)